MRKFLSKLTTERLFTLASNYSLQGADRSKMIEDLVEFYKGYRILVADVKSAYPDLAEIN